MRIRWLATALLTMAGTHCFGQVGPPPMRRELRAAWTATVYNIDWPSSRTATTTQQKAQIVTILNTLRDLKMNAVLVQVRPQCDAFYGIQTEPWSEFLTNVMGNAPNPYYDPLAYWIQEARTRGIEVHAWINPYRAKAGTGTVATQAHVTNSHPYMVRTYGTNKWIDPGHNEAQGYTLAAINRIVANYDVDGIVIDDYFYPYPISGTPFPDDDTYAIYLANGGSLSKANWRRQNVDTLVQAMYQTIKSAKPWVKFGISPFGIWRPGNPSGVTGLDAYASLYADSKKWINNGWCDYFSPQLYWTIGSTGQPYGPLLTWWTQQNTMGRVIAPSNSVSSVGSAGDGWPVSEITNQITLTRDTPGAQGNVHYSVKVLRDNRDGLKTTLINGVYATPALIPWYSWLDPTPPGRPRLTIRSSWQTAFVYITPPEDEVIRWFTVYSRYGRTWTSELLPGTTTSFTKPRSNAFGSLGAIHVGAVDRTGGESARSVVDYDRPGGSIGR